MEVLENNRGGIKISFEGHVYVRKMTHLDGKIRWQCERQRSEACSGAITTNGPPQYGGVMAATPHNHEPDQDRTRVIAARAGLKRTARDVNSGPTTEIVANALMVAHPEIRGQLGQLSALRRDVQRQRYE